MSLSRVVSFEQTTKRGRAIVNMQTNTAQANGADQSNGSVRVPLLRGEGSGFAWSGMGVMMSILPTSREGPEARPCFQGKDESRGSQHREG